MSARWCVDEPDTGCTPRIAPVCGCDGTVYEDDCVARAADVELAGFDTQCADPPDMFRCGYTFCAVGQDFCREVFEGGWYCDPLPAQCAGTDPPCDCIAGDRSGGGEGGANAATTWPELIGDSRCRECVDSGPGLKINCIAF
jgi:hypothetical protein